MFSSVIGFSFDEFTSYCGGPGLTLNSCRKIGIRVALDANVTQSRNKEMDL